MPDTTSLPQLHQNYFELLALPVGYPIDLALLDQHYRKLQSEVHPDRFVAASSADQLQSMQLATQVNDAYRTLKNPTTRARYLLQLQGIETLEESNTAMPADFLMLQMEWREAAEDAEAAHDITALETLIVEINRFSKELQATLPDALASQATWTDAAETVRKLSFIDKVRADLTQTVETLENTTI